MGRGLRRRTGDDGDRDGDADEDRDKQAEHDQAQLLAAVLQAWAQCGRRDEGAPSQ